MTRTLHKFTAVVVVVAAVAAAGGYWFARRSVSAGAMQTLSAADRKALYWYDPMVPNQHFDSPGKSPFMDMQLVPKYVGESESHDSASIHIDPGITQNLGVRLTTVERGVVAQPLDAVGSIIFNQRHVALVQARTAGFVTRAYARASGDVLKRGDALVDLLVPEWAGAQSEFIALIKNGDSELISAARQRLQLLGMSDESINRVEAERQLTTTVTIRTPIAGAIESLEVREGMTVNAGATLAKITGLESVWLEAAIPEVQGALATLGQSVEVRLTAYPAQVFNGQVVAVLPETNVETRTLRVRIELQNPTSELKPGMFAKVRLDASNNEPALYVASEAVIRSGTRNIVLRADDKGSFTPTEVQLGAEANGKSVILSGLAEGQQVVASGQFLIDSEASLSGVLARLENKQPTSNEVSAPHMLHEATGKVESITADKFVVSHGPVATLNWPAMTMGFKLERADLIATIKVGDQVRLRFSQVGDDYVVSQVEKLGSQP
jgi:Cu(I)/Ag(I) efflux system membrane fusion protein